jgi:DNA-binding IscR family transcriptional regulator
LQEVWVSVSDEMGRYLETQTLADLARRARIGHRDAATDPTA